MSTADSPQALVREARLAAGLSQRDLARRAGTSQPAIARYERGLATPSWETLERLAAACGRRLTIGSEIAPDPHDVQLAETQLARTPLERSTWT
jgi:transcriptional regulator with XRE-family HTH domain